MFHQELGEVLYALVTVFKRHILGFSGSIQGLCQVTIEA